MLRLASAMVFSVVLLLVKLIADSGVAVGEIVLWRQIVSAPAILLWLLPQPGGLARLRTRRLGAHALRATVGMSSMAILFGGASLLPLAEFTTFGFTTALFAVLIAAMVLREPVGPWRWAAVVLGFAGVVVIAAPDARHVDSLGAALALTSSLLVAIINHQIRDLARTEEPLTIVFWFGFFGSLIGGALLPFFYTPHDSGQWLLLLSLGALGLVAQLLLSASLRYGAVASVIVMDYTGLIWAALLGWLVWSDLPALTTWLGAPLIIGAGLIIAWRERLHARPAVPASPFEAE